MSSRLAVSVFWSLAVFAVPLVAAAAPATYQYTGLVFSDSVPSGGLPACPQCFVHGSVTFSAPLAPNLPFTDLTGMVLSFSFADDGPSTPAGFGTGPLTNANATFSSFLATTDAAGGLKTWTLEANRNDQPASIRVHTQNTNAAAADFGVSQFGNGYDGASSQAGRWTNPSAATVPALPRSVPYALAALLLAAGVFGARRARSAAGLPR
jgi:hypothetical protein